MVIDVDDEVLIQAGDAGPRQIAAFHDDRRVEVPVDAVRDLDVGHSRKGHQRSRRRVGVDDADLLAERAQRERHRHLRADRVAVRPRVR